MEYSKWAVLGLFAAFTVPFVPFLVIKLARAPLIVLSILLLALPFHTLIFQVARVELGLSAGVSLFLQSWKELLILTLVVLVAAKMLATGKYTGTAPTVFALTVLFMLSGFIGFLISPTLSTAIFGFRGIFEPFVVFALMLCLPITLTWLRKITPLLLGLGASVAVFAIFQSLILGYSFIQKYYALDGVLPSSFSFVGGTIQRAMGTFSSPNQLSLYLVFLILIAANLLLRSTSLLYRAYLTTCAILMAIALVFTVSRSGWIALLVGISVSFVIWRHKTRFIVATILILMVAIPTFFVFELDRHFVNTVQGRDPSANYRTQLTITNLNTILDNPLGVGIGVVGARAQYLEAVGIQTYSTESYLLQMAMELGIIGISLFLLLMGVIAANLYRNIFQVDTPFARAWTVAALSCLFAALAHAVFIPDLQDLTVATYLFAILAIGIWLPRLEQIRGHAISAQRTIRQTTNGELLWHV